MDHEGADRTPLDALRAAAVAVADLDGTGVDAGVQADRFEALHTALVAVLADADRS